MRLFIAVLLSDQCKAALTGVQEALRKNGYRGHYIEDAALHVTVTYIGEYNDPDHVLAVMEGLPFAPFRMSLAGYIGNFDDLLWAGVRADDALGQYVKRLRHALADAQIPFDRKAYHPHITLLRHAQGQRPFAEIHVPEAVMTVRSIVLMRSDLRQRGAAYTELGRMEAIG